RAFFPVDCSFEGQRRNRKITYYEIGFSIPFQIPGIHCQPSSRCGIWNGEGPEIKAALIFKVYKAFFGMIDIIGKKRNSRNVKISVIVIVPRNCFKTTMHREEIFLTKPVITVIEKNIKSMIGL